MPAAARPSRERRGKIDAYVRHHAVQPRSIHLAMVEKIHRKYEYAPELKVEIFKHLVDLQPIVVKAGSSKQEREGWMILTHVTKAWRHACVKFGPVWAENICAYPDSEAVLTFIERSLEFPRVVDFDRLLLGCYATKQEAAIDILLSSCGALLKTAKTITSSLLVFSLIDAPFDALRTHLGPDTWPYIFDCSVFGNLTTLVYHMTGDETFPTIVNSKIERLELISVTKRTIIEQVDDFDFSTSYYNSPAWDDTPTFSTDNLLSGLQLHMKARSIKLRAVHVVGGSGRNLEPIDLPLLETLCLQGPNAERLMEIHTLIAPLRTSGLTLVSSTDEFTPPLSALSYSGVLNQPGLTLTIEAGYDVHWSTLSTPNTDTSCINTFSDGENQDFLTAEESGSANLYVRSGRISRKTSARQEHHDAFMGIPEEHITRLVYKPLHRTYEGEMVWQMRSWEFSFVAELKHLQTVWIEDERVADTICDQLNSATLKDIHIVCRPDWRGKESLICLSLAVRKAAMKAGGHMTVTMHGVKRMMDEDAMYLLRQESTVTLRDERVVTEGVHSLREKEQLQYELQKSRIRVEQSKVASSIKPQETNVLRSIAE
ncbi:hypothetical protein PENSPDRAFT_669262 [Peniophora sp. CONT]|nr:hypothetical protein PENSPDRAFT_669262 [Peniophora sp. CONT]